MFTKSVKALKIVPRTLDTVACHGYVEDVSHRVPLMSPLEMKE